MVSADIWKWAISRLEEFFKQAETTTRRGSEASSLKSISGFESKFRQFAGNRTGSRVLDEISKNLGRKIESPNNEDMIIPKKIPQTLPPDEVFASEPTQNNRPLRSKSFVPPDVDEFLENQQGDSRKKQTIKSERELKGRMIDMRYREHQQLGSSTRDKSHEYDLLI